MWDGNVQILFKKKSNKKERKTESIGLGPRLKSSNGEWKYSSGGRVQTGKDDVYLEYISTKVKVKMDDLSSEDTDNWLKSGVHKAVRKEEVKFVKN